MPWAPALVVVKSNEPEPPTPTLRIRTSPRWMLWNVHVTVSSAASEIASASEPSLHVADARSQPDGVDSATEYKPTGRSAASWVSPSASENAPRSPVKLNDVGLPAGSVVLAMMIVPVAPASRTLWNTQVTVSPASTSTASTVEPSSHVADPRVQPSTAASEIPYRPGVRSTKLC